MRIFERPSLKHGTTLTAGAILGATMLTGCGEPTSADIFAASLRTDTDRVLAGQQSQGNYKTIDTRQLTVAQAAVAKALATMRGRFYFQGGDSRENSTTERLATIICWTADQTGLLTADDRETVAESFATGDALLETGALNDNPHVYNQNTGYIEATNHCDSIVGAALDQGKTISIPIGPATS